MSSSKQISTVEQITAIAVVIGVALLIECFGHVSPHYERFVVRTGAALWGFMVILLWQITAGRKKKPPS
jgi:hypothetical protein